jgi:hypothetical protein
MVGGLLLYCPALQELDLSRTKLSDTTISLLFNQLRSLRKLNLEACSHLSDEAFQIAPSDTPLPLETLNLNFCNQISDKAIIKLLQAQPSLRHLWLIECSLISDLAILLIAQNSPYLELLDVESNPNVTDRTLVDIAVHCPQLELLSLARTPVTDRSIKILSKFLPKLRYLDLFEVQVSDEAIDEICKFTNSLTKGNSIIVEVFSPSNSIFPSKSESEVYEYCTKIDSTTERVLSPAAICRV